MALYRPVLMLVLVVGILLIGSSVLLARRNLRLGRGDRRGAARLAVLALLLTVALALLGGHHVPRHSKSFRFSAECWRTA